MIAAVIFALIGVSLAMPSSYQKAAAPAYAPAAPSYAPSAPAYHQSAPSYASAPAYHHADGYKATPVPIVQQDNSANGDGAYKFSYASGDYSYRAENSDNQNYVQGSYSYISPEGKKVEVAYTADQNGFQAHGDHLPQAPQNPFNLQMVITPAQYSAPQYSAPQYSAPAAPPRYVPAAAPAPYVAAPVVYAPQSPY